MFGGVAEKCNLANNSATAYEYAYGGGVYANILQTSISSFIEACIVTNNSVTTTDNYVYTAALAAGGGLNIGNGTTVRSTLVAGNTALSVAGFTSGGGVSSSGSTIENCTIAYNAATSQNGNQGAGGGVIWGYSDACYNNIVKFNNADNGPDNGEVNAYSYPLFYNSDIGAVVPAANLTNCINVDPVFVNGLGGNYHLQSTSPCIGAGTNQAWMVGAVDLDGNPRISGTTVDIGAYEFTANPPIISARLNLNNLILQWPASFQGYSLWWTTNLSGSTWISNGAAPSVVNGQYTLTNPITGAKSFFRLAK